MQHRSRRSTRPEDGGSAVEYGVLISAIVVIVAVAVALFGSLVSDMYANVF